MAELPYDLTRIFDHVEIRETSSKYLKGVEHMWGKGMDAFPSRLYEGSITMATKVPTVSVNVLEMDMRIAIERNKIEVIGRDPEFMGLDIHHGPDAQRFLEGYPEGLYQTVVVIYYLSGMLIIDEVKYASRLSEWSKENATGHD